MTDRKLCTDPECTAYLWPHRLGSGKCGEQREERAIEEWLRNMTREERLGWMRAADANVD